MKYRKNLGKWGEKAAEDYLSQKGYQIVARNTRTPYGEIDLLAMDGNTLVFVEVKTRASSEFGFPEESVTTKKQTHMINAAQAYFQAHPDLEENWRLDVIAIRKLGTGLPLEIIHFENVLA